MFWIGALEALGEGRGECADQVRIFAERLLGAAPAGIAAEVGVGRADDDASAVVERILVVVAGLVAFNPGDLLE